MNRIKKLLFVFALSLVSVFPVRAFAQSSNALTYGQTIEGEITDSQPSISYTFKAAANDVFVVTMQQDGTDSSVNPRISLLDSKQETIADTKGQTAIFSVNLAGQLTDAGTYTITASSDDGTSKGKFKLYLAKADMLTADKSVKGTTSSDTYAFYAYNSGDPFIVAYQKEGGDFTATVSVNKVSDHEMKESGTFGGSEIDRGALGVKPSEKSLYIVSIGEGTFDLNFDKVSADYSLVITEGK